MTSSEVYVENLSSQAVWFDDLEIATGALPTALVVQETHYEPFGLELAGIGYIADPTLEDKFTYNGKEKQDQFGLGWLDYHARQVDPVLGRMWGVDPLASKFAPVSPYNYALNNPLRVVDPTGMAPKLINSGNALVDAAWATTADGENKSYSFDGSGGGEGSNPPDYNVEAYVLFWASSQSETGAGHSSIAIPQLDKNGNTVHSKNGQLFDYYTYYRDKSYGDQKDRLATGLTMGEILNYDKEKGLQSDAPAVALMLNIKTSQVRKMANVGNSIVGHEWSLVRAGSLVWWNDKMGWDRENVAGCGAGNCANITKEMLKVAGYNPGFSFGFATPTDLYQDLMDNHGGITGPRVFYTNPHVKTEEMNKSSTWGTILKTIGFD